MQIIPEHLRPELKLRISRLQNLLEELPAEAMLVASNANIYYTSLRFFRGYVYIPSSGPAVRFVIRPTDTDEEEGVVRIHKPEQILPWLEANGYGSPASVAMEFGDLTYSDIMRLQKAFPHARCLDASPLLRRARMTKTEWELQRMKEDGLHQAQAYRRFTKVYREGMTDVEFQIEMERVLRLEGCLGYSRVSGSLMEINLGSVISGDNADIPTPYDFAMGGGGTDSALPVGADGTEMKPGTTVMVDMNGAFNGYQTDMTRCWRIGEIPPLAQKAHECSRRILRELEKFGRPGVKCAAMYDRAMEIVEEEGLLDYFMGHRQKVAFIGHGVGIQLNEAPVLTPRSRDELQENMTIAIEPKFVIPHVGAVGVENTYIVRADGLENITIFPETITDLR